MKKTAKIRAAIRPATDDCSSAAAMTLVVVALAVTILAVAVLAGCVQDQGTTAPADTTTVSTAGESANPIDLLHFSTETELVAAIKSAAESVGVEQLGSLSYYFRLRLLPEGARIADIRVKGFHVTMDYVIGSSAPDSKTNRLTFIWYRTLSGDDMKNCFVENGFPWTPMKANARYNFYTNENVSFNPETGEIDEKAPREEVCKVIQWTQGNRCFQVNAPLWFTEDDVLKYCVAEIIQVK